MITTSELPHLSQAEVFNNFRQKFIRYFFSDDELSLCVYCCEDCKKCFTSKTSFSKHTHHIDNKETFKYDEAESLHSLLDVIAVCDISLRTVASDVFDTFCSKISPFFQVPSREKLRKYIKDYATYIHYNNLFSIRGEFCYILLDGANKFHHKLEGIIIVTFTNIFFWKFEEVLHATGKTLMDIITEVIKDLKLNNNRVIAIVTDNATNNVFAFSADVGRCQQLAKEYFIQVRCLCHTLDLALRHTFEMISNEPLLDGVKKLLAFYSHFTGIDGPSITIRWESITECVKFITERLDEIKKYIQIEKSQKKSVKQVVKALNAFINLPLEDLLAILQHFSKFLDDLQGDHDTIYKFWDSFKQFNIDIANYTKYPFTRNLFENIIFQIKDKQTIGITLLAYAFTEDGYQTILHSPYQPIIKKFLTFVLRTYLFDTDQCSHFYIYLKEFDKYMDPKEHNTPVSYDYWENSYLTKKQNLAEIAVQILGIPSSEAPVERLFAHLTSMFRCDPFNMGLDLINERMTIKCQYYLTKKKIQKTMPINERIENAIKMNFKQKYLK